MNMEDLELIVDGWKKKVINISNIYRLRIIKNRRRF